MDVIKSFTRSCCILKQLLNCIVFKVDNLLWKFLLISVSSCVRLREIKMSEYDAKMYESYSSHVRRQVQSLRVILDSLQARGKERVWLRNQTSGELDDGKLIEGLTGERAIYKKRGEEDPEVHTAKSPSFNKAHFINIMSFVYK